VTLPVAAVPPEDPRVAGLRRMRMLATLLLVAMTALFIVASLGEPKALWLGYVRAFAEAGMVGACADWFAVVALFRHPLGIPIPHTAIVPHNKVRIAGAMGRFLTNNFLTPRVLKERLADLEISHWLAAWLASPENARRMSRGVVIAIPEIVRVLPREQIAEATGRWLQRGLEALPAAPVAANLLAIAWAQGQTQQLVERSLELLEMSVVQNKDAIRKKIEAGSSRWVPRWVDGMVADKVVTALATTLTEMRDPAHPWRIELKVAIEALIERLRSDAELVARIEAVKAEMIADPLFQHQLQALWSEIENRLPSDAEAYARHVGAVVEKALVAAGDWLQDDVALQSNIDRWARHLIKRTVSQRRTEIGAFVTRVVENWDDTTLVKRMELQVGRDLQYIRINGTLVGGMVGLVIHTASRWLLPG